MSRRPGIDWSSNESLRRQNEALLRLATALVGNREDAEDALQDTWLAALRQPPGHVRNPDGWLRRVLRYRVFHLRRETTKRSYRELRAVREDATCDPVMGDDDAELRDVLMLAVRQVGEPYQATLLARFEAGLSIREISEELGRPPATIKSQINRGLRQAREILDRRSGDGRDDWRSLALLYLARPRGRAGPTPITRPSRRWVHTSARVLALCAGSFGLWSLLDRPLPRVVPDRPAVTQRSEPRVATLDEELSRARSPIEFAPDRVRDPADPRGRRIARIDGQVRELRGRPVPGAEVWATEAHHPERARLVATADDQGRFTVSDVLARTWLGARSDGYVLRDWTSLEMPEFAQPEVAPLFLRLTPGKTFTGTLVDVEGRPVSNAVVEASDHRGGRSWYQSKGLWRFPATIDSTVSRTDGNFALEVHPKLTQVLTIRAPGYAPMRVTLRPKKPLARMTEAITMIRGASVRGRVALPGGQAAARAHVEYRSSHGDVVTAAANQQGNFEIDHLPLGDGILRVWGQGPDRVLSHVSALSVERSGIHRTDVRLSQERTLRGRAIDDAGEPLQGWLVRKCSAECGGRPDVLSIGAGHRDEVTSTSADGSFSFSACVEESCRLFLFPPDGSQPRAHRRATIGEQGLVLQPCLPDRLSSVRGRVGRLLEEGALVVLRSNTLADDEYAPVGPPEHEYTFCGLLPGDYELLSWERNGQPTSLTSFRLRPGEELDLGSRHAPARGALEVDVRDPSGAPVPGSTIHLLAVPENHRIAKAKTNGLPTQLEFVAPGEYELAVRAAGFGSVCQGVRVVSGQVSPVAVTLHPGRRIALELRSTPDCPNGTLRLEIDGDDGVPFRTIESTPYFTPVEEVHTFLPSGRYTARAATDTHWSGSVDFEVTPSRKTLCVLVPLEPPAYE